MSGKTTTAIVAALLLASAAPAFAKTHSARHSIEPHRPYGEQARSSRERSQCDDLGPGPTVVLPNFGPTSGEDVASLLGCR